MRFPGRRFVLVALIGLLVGGGFGFWRSSRSANPTTNVSGAYLDQIMAGVCRMKSELATGNRFGASNTFWGDVHLPAHALAAALLTENRAAAGNFSRSKMGVERSLSTLRPDLSKAVDSFEVATRTALVVAKRPTPRPCP